MAESVVDPNLVKATTQDFSWINQGVKDGQDYAMKASQIETQRDAIQARLQEHQNQASLIKGQMGLKLANSIRTMAYSEPKSAARKQQIEALQAMSDAWGHKLAPGLTGHLLEMPQNDAMVKVGQAIKDAPDPSEIWPMLAKIPEFVQSEDFKPLADQFLSVYKQKQEQENKIAIEQMGNASKEKIAAMNNAGKVEDKLDKRVTGLRKEVAAVDQKMGSVLQAPEIIQSALDAGGAQDFAAAQQILKLIGDSRVSTQEIKGMERLGTIADRLETFGLKNVVSGDSFSPAVRAQLKQLVSNVAEVRNAGYRKLMGPKYKAAISDPKLKAAFDRGEIFDNPEQVSKIFNSSEAPASRFSPAQQAFFRKAAAQGKTRADIQKLTNQQLTDEEAKAFGIGE